MSQRVQGCVISWENKGKQGMGGIPFDIEVVGVAAQARD